MRAVLGRRSEGVLLVLALAAGLGGPAHASPPGEAEWRLEGAGRGPERGGRGGRPGHLRNRATGFERLTRTDGGGAFAFSGLRIGPYELVASARGFASAVRSIEGPAPPIDVALQPAEIIEQLTVVSGSRQAELRDDLNTRVDVVTRESVRDTGYETVGEVLRELPGVLTRRGSETAGAAGEQVQGIDSRQVLVLLDGQPLVGGRGIKRGVINLDRQSFGRLERVEVVKGASSALYGSDAIGGVINLVTREPERPFEGSLLASGGSHGILDARGDAGFSQGRWRGLVGLERHENDGFDLFPTTPDTTGAPFRRNDLYAKLRFQATPSFALLAFANGYWNDSTANVVGELGLQRSAVAEDAQSYGLSAEWRPGARTRAELRGYFARFEETSDNRLLAAGAGPIPRDELYERLGKLDGTFSAVLGERQLLQAGAESWHDRYRGVNRLRDEDGHEVETRVLWAQDRISLTRRVTLTLGARYDDNSIFGSAFSPKAGVNVALGGGAHLRVSYGRGFRAWA